MTTISISLDEKTKNDLDDMVKKYKISRSDIVRTLIIRSRLQRTVLDMHEIAEPKLSKLGIKNDEDLVKYL